MSTFMSALARRGRSAAPLLLLTALIPLGASFSACSSGSDDLPTTTGDTTQTMPPTGDALPAGAISFFKVAACPEGWTPLAEGKGRFPIPTIGQDPPLKTAGEPLKDGEDRLHGHALSAELELAAVSYAGVAGEANHGVAAQQTVPIAATADKASSGLPYVQLLACKKLGEPRPGTAPLPKGLLIYWNGTTCPEGFSQPIATQGRMVVGLPKDAPPGLSFGGTSLKSAETRKHMHGVAGSVTTTPHGIALASGCCADNYAKDGQYDYAGSSDEVGAGLPTIQILQCQKM